MKHNIIVENVSVKHLSIVKETPKFENPQTELVYELLKRKIGIEDIRKNPDLMKKVCNEFFSKSQAFQMIKAEIIKEAIQILKLDNH